MLVSYADDYKELGDAGDFLLSSKRMVMLNLHLEPLSSLQIASVDVPYMGISCLYVYSIFCIVMYIFIYIMQFSSKESDREKQTDRQADQKKERNKQTNKERNKDKRREH